MQVKSSLIFRDLYLIKSKRPSICFHSNRLFDEAVSFLIDVGAVAKIFEHATVPLCDALVLDHWISSEQIATLPGVPVICNFRSHLQITEMQEAISAFCRTTDQKLILICSNFLSTHRDEGILNIFDYQNQVRQLAKNLGCVIWVQDHIHLITDGLKMAFVYSGHNQTGEKGCSLASAVCAPFLAVNQNAFQAAVHSAAFLHVALEKNNHQIDSKFFNHISEQDFEKYMRVEIF